MTGLGKLLSKVTLFREPLLTEVMEPELRKIAAAEAGGRASRDGRGFCRVHELAGQIESRGFAILGFSDRTRGRRRL